MTRQSLLSLLFVAAGFLTACAEEKPVAATRPEIWLNRQTLWASLPGATRVEADLMTPGGKTVRTARAEGDTLVFGGLDAGRLYNVTFKNDALTLGAMTPATAPEGYTERSSARPGDRIPLFISSPLTTVTVTLVKMWGSAVPGAQVTFGDVPDAFHSRVCASNGCDWPLIGHFEIPDVKSGYYLLRFENEAGATDYPFVIKSKTPGAHGLAVIAATNTWQAYNTWGGASYYNNDIEGPYLRWVSFRRPYGLSTVNGSHLLGGEKHLARWLELQNIDYDLYTDEDVDAGELDGHYSAWVFHVHSEYWTSAMLKRYLAHVRAGGKAVFLSGDVMTWNVSYTDDRRMFKQKKHANNKNGYFTGSTYSGGDYGTFAPYACLAPSHWVFEGTGLDLRAEFGAENEFGGASGHETDEIKPGTQGRTLLAKGRNPNGGADMFVYPMGKGEVFHVGSLTFTGSLHLDPKVSRILRNVIRKYTGQ